MDKGILYDWLFHYNHFTGKWAAFRRGDYVHHFNNGENSLRSSNINTLIEIIRRCDGDTSKLKTKSEK